MESAENTEMNITQNTLKNYSTEDTESFSVYSVPPQAVQCTQCKLPVCSVPAKGGSVNSVFL
jgi:hypothetical protein